MRSVTGGVDRHGLDDSVATWLRGFGGDHVSFGLGGVRVTDYDLAHDFGRRGRAWHVLFRERGGPVSTLVTGDREHAQRHLVWRLASTAQTAAGRTATEYPVAPERVPAADGPLRVLDGSTEVWAEHGLVATFGSRSEAVEFTHYGWLPVDLLIAQIMGPAEDMVFPAGARHRDDEEQAEEGRRIRRGLLELLQATLD